MTEKLLFRTNVGSKMWAMDHPGSDVDVYEVVQVPTRDILLGRERTSFPNRTHEEDGTKFDIQTHEVGNVVHQLLEGNINAIWGVFSPIVLYECPDLPDVPYALREAARRNLSRRCYKSLEGLAYHNMRKYVTTGKDTSLKRLNIMARTLQQGVTLLRTGRIEFAKTSVTTPEEVSALIGDLKSAYDLSVLPEGPPEPELLEAWLLAVRHAYWSPPTATDAYK